MPEVVFDGTGTWLAVWDSWDTLDGTIGLDNDILRAYSADGGLTWSEPGPLNNCASIDSEDDFRPQILHRGDGGWLAAWESRENLGGAIGFDHDIVFARGRIISDCNGNYVPDDCDLADCDGSPWCEDCNGNYTLDECDIASGYSWDDNGDGDVDLEDFSLFQ